MHFTRTQEAVKNIWEEVLERGHIGLDDNFFELGGTSLQAMKMIYQIYNRFSVELPLDVLADKPTVAKLAQQIEDCLQQQGTGSDRLAPEEEREQGSI